SELLAAYPWGFSGVSPNASEQLPDTGAFDGSALVFREDGKLPHPNAEVHHYAALVAADRRPESGVADDGPHRGPQGNHVCTAEEPPSACDDGPFGKGVGGQLRYRITVPGRASRTLWVAVAGSDAGLAPARSELAAALRDPDAAFAAKQAARQELSHFTDVSLPGDPRLAEGLDWGKQNIADLTQTAENLAVRYVDQGKQYPPPQGRIARARWVGAGFPDYPWIFATDAEYTAFASVALGQFEAIEDHMRTLRDYSDIVNERSGKVTHEIVSEGANWFGQNKDPGNTDETVKFPSTVALIWRWTGDDRFRDQMYDFAKRNLRYVDATLDTDRDGWPEGLGNVERNGMGEEKLDNTVYYIRGLYDLADMARSKKDDATFAWARNKARDLQRRFEAAWWMPEVPQHADSLDDPGDVKQQQKHWIGVTPMEAELTVDQRAEPGLTTHDHGTQALALRETSCFSGETPYNRGLFHTGCLGGPEGKGEQTIFSLTTSIQSVGEGNYGRLGAGQQRRYTDANVEPMFGEPAANGEPDEQPGAMPEILPSPDFGAGPDPRDKNIDRCWTCRAMFMQAWGNYGTAWPVVHQQLGVRPDLGRGDLTVVPQLPSASPITGENIRLGTGALALVRASRDGGSYTSTVDTGSAPVQRLFIGHTLPRGSRPTSVVLDGERQSFEQRRTNRGEEITVKTDPGTHTLVVRSG
ncbi:MAG: glycogen debranching protein, partial [Actinomycetota bacterium]|nr:glycogen debranching protein [Actinomycetota bacterium]